MARATNPRTLREQVQLLRGSVTRLLNRAGEWVPFGSTSSEFSTRPLRARQRADFVRLVNETRALAAVSRALRPIDAAWRYYDTSMQEVLEYLTQAESAFRKEVSEYAPWALRKALEMVEGAISRMPRELTRLPHDARELARRAAGDDGARVVLGDLLEERGRGDLAELVRADDVRIDKNLLPILAGETALLEQRQLPKPRTRRWMSR